MERIKTIPLDDFDKENLKDVFEYLEVSKMDECVECDEEFYSEASKFYVSGGGPYCEDCYDRELEEIEEIEEGEMNNEDGT